LEQAKRLARVLDCRIVLVHVAEPEPDFVGFDVGPQVVRAAVASDMKAEHERLLELKRKVEEEGYVASAFQLRGPAARKIIEEAEKLDAGMIVLGSHGRGALYNLLVGSVTAEVLRRSPVPVVVVPARGRGAATAAA